jgi:hypothetical protein
MSECDHEVDWSGGGDFCCKLCGVRICTDCGTRPAHEDSPPNYCRRCSEKGGHRYAFFTEIDHDKLRAKVGREAADAILSECRYD